MDCFSKFYDEVFNEQQFLYRFVGLDVFADILLRQEFAFVSPCCWDDTYELSFLRSYLNKKIAEMSIPTIDLYCDYEKFKPLIDMQLHLDTVRGQCWTTLSESDAMWRIYNNGGKTIRLCMSVEGVKSLKNVFPVKVTYTDTFEGNKLNGEDIYWLYKMMNIKRTAFTHENEVRLLVESERTIDRNEVLYAEYLQHFQSHYLKKHRNEVFDEVLEKPLLQPVYLHGEEMLIDDYLLCAEEAKPPLVMHVPMNNKTIYSVMVSPFAPDWYCETIKLLCEKYSITYVGQSKLYDKPAE